MAERSKSSLRSRWLVLALTCTVMTGSYYTYDIPAALHQQLKDYMPRSHNYERNFNLLYTVYSVPNVILPLFGGGFVDRYGAPLCLTVFSLTSFLGAICLSIGVGNRSWELMYLGRFVFGIGMESVCVAQSTVLSDWFGGREVALAMGIRRGISVLGKVWNNMMSPVVANNGSQGGIEAAFLIGALMTCFSVIASGSILLVDNWATKSLKRMAEGGEALPSSLTSVLLENEDGSFIGGTGHQRLQQEGNSDNPQGGNLTHENEAPKKKGVNCSEIGKFSPLFWLLAVSCVVVYGCILPFNNVSSGLLLERNLFTSPPSDCRLEHPDQCSAGYLQPGSNQAIDLNANRCIISTHQAPVLPTSVNHTWADSGKSSEWDEATYVFPELTPDHVDCGDPFWSQGCASDYCEKQNSATEHAGKIMSIPYLISGLMSPVMGHLVDRIGRRAQIITFASSMLALVHLTLALTARSPIVPLIVQGIGYALFSAVIWPSVSLTVPKSNTGTAFGVVTSTQNLGMAIFPIVIASIFNSSGMQYLPNVELFFVGLAALGAMLGVIMHCLDKRYGSKLNEVTRKEEEVSNSSRKNAAEQLVFENNEEYFSPLLHAEEGVIS